MTQTGDCHILYLKLIVHELLPVQMQFQYFITSNITKSLRTEQNQKEQNFLCLSQQEMDGLVFNATFNNISAISWRSVLLVGETRVPGETTDL